MHIITIVFALLTSGAPYPTYATNPDMVNTVVSTAQERYGVALSAELDRESSRTGFMMGMCRGGELKSIVFNPSFVLQAQQDPHLVAATLAHEIGHCRLHKYVGIDAEYAADEYGAALFVKTGGTVEQYVQRFKDRDAEVSDTHPSDSARLERVYEKAKKGKTTTK